MAGPAPGRAPGGPAGGVAIILALSAGWAGRDLLAALPGAEAALSSADALYLPALFLDIAGGGRLADWALTPGPYVFPDMAVFGLAWALTPGWAAAVAVNAALQTVLILLLAAALGATLNVRAGGRGALHAILTVPACLALPVALAFALAPEAAFPVFGVPILPGFHAGAAISALAGFVLLLARGGTGRRGMTIAALTIATGLSDSFFLLFFSAPALLLLLREAVADRSGRDAHLRLLVWTGGAALAVLALQDLVNPLGGAYRHQLALGHEHGLWRLGQIVGEPGAAAALAIAVAAWLPAGLAGAMALGRPGRSRPLDALALLVATGGLCTLFLPVALGLLRDLESSRYLLPVTLFGPLWLGLRLAAAGRACAMPLGLLTLAGTAWGLLLPAPRLVPPPAIACLPEGPVLTDYWHAKPLRLFSGGRIAAIPVTAAGRPYLWIASAAWWQDAAPIAILSAGLDRAAIETAFGVPSRVVRCADAEVWYVEDPAGAGAVLATSEPARLP